MTKIKDVIRSIYSTKQKSLFTSTIVVTIALLLARLVGLFKLRILTGYYTAPELDIFFAAFRLPDFIFDLLITGTISAVYIPIVSGIMQNNDENDERTVIQFTTTLILTFFGVWFVALLFIIPFRYQLFHVLLPGFPIGKSHIVADMSVILLLLQMPFLMIGAIVGAFMQSRKQFLIPGLAPVFYNLGIIIGIIVWANAYGLRAAFYGIALGAVLYMLVVLPVLFTAHMPKKFINFASPHLRSFFRMFVPRSASVAVTQIDATVDLALASMRSTGDYASFYLAQSLQVLPVTFIGVALGQTVLPFYSEYAAKKQYSELMESLTRILLLIFFITMPIIVFFTALRVPIIRLVFGGDKFDWNATVTTAVTLSIFAVAMPFFTSYYILSRTFFALKDVVTPFVVGVCATLLNTILSITFIMVLQLPIWSLALAFAIAITLHSLTLFFILLLRLDKVRLWNVVWRIGAILLIGLLSLFVVWFMRKLLDGLVFDTTRTIQVFWLVLTCVVAGLGIYFYFAWIVVPEEFGEAIRLFARLQIARRAVDSYKKIMLNMSNYGGFTERTGN